MKIVMVMPYLKSIGGANRYGWELSEYLASCGDEVILVSLYTDEKLFSSKENIRIVNLADETSLTQSIKFWLNLRKTRKKLFDLIKKEKPNIVFFNHYPSTMWAQKFSDIPIICYPQDVNLLYTDTYINNLPFSKRIPWRFIRLFVRFYDKNKWKNFDEIICHSKFTAKNVKRFYNFDSKVMLLGTDITKFSPKNIKKSNCILTLGDTKIRRADLLLKAAAKLSKKRNDFKIWIVGSKGELDNELKNIVKKFNLSEHVEFFGKVSDERLVELYSQAMVVVHLVKEAPFGLIVTESMSCGTPVISWTPGGPEEIIIDGKSGFLINENDQNELVKKIEIFLNEPELSLKMGSLGREHILSNFDLAKHHQIMREHLLNWISKKKSSFE
jgi:glycosyltransferase involved in cell wall biosynthesis